MRLNYGIRVRVRRGIALSPDGRLYTNNSPRLVDREGKRQGGETQLGSLRLTRGIWVSSR